MEKEINQKSGRKILLILPFLALCIIGMLTVSATQALGKGAEQMTQIEQDIKLVQETNATAEARQQELDEYIQNIDTSTGDAIVVIAAGGWKPDRKPNNMDAHQEKIDEYDRIFDITDCETKMLYMDEALRDSGRLYIPSCGVNVPLNSSVGYKKLQDVVDEEDLALMFYIAGDRMIADHAGQGFDKMKQAEVGTMAFIKTKTGFQKLVCTEKERADNVGYALFTDSGKRIGFVNLDGITMYTCNDFTGVNVTITYWKFDDFTTDDFERCENGLSLKAKTEVLAAADGAE